MQGSRNRSACNYRQILLLILSIILYYQSVFPAFQQDTTLLIPKGSYLKFRDFRSFIAADTLIRVPATLSRATGESNLKTLAFYDSLKTKASKTLITKTLFDLVIVRPDKPGSKYLTSKSEEGFIQYSGSTIRTITVKRLNVFGADISNPGLYEPGGLEKFLNGTHINTNESIIRKNLIFKEGDTISPLRLTDNERILRQLPYIDDARIIVIPVTGEEADILVITKDVYSIGGDFTYRGKGNGSIWLFEKNIFGMGHEFRMEVPFSSESQDSPGLGLTYLINNFEKTFVNLNLSYYNALDVKRWSVSLSRNLISSETKYAGGISIKRMNTVEDLDTLPEPVPLEYTFQDYWVQRSFMLDRASVSRLVTGLRYINNNVFEKPEILPETYYSLQKFRLYLGSMAFSRQKYYETNLLYSYGRTEDIPYGMLLRITGGVEKNEFKKRTYFGTDAAFGFSLKSLGYFHFSAGTGAFLKHGSTEQGIFFSRMVFFSNLLSAGRHRIRNFIDLNYTRGFDRYEDEYLTIIRENGFSGFRNDSLRGAQRVDMSIETVVFTPANIYGFRFAVFGFADLAFLSGTNEYISEGRILSGIGLGLRVRNDNLVFSTFELRLGFFPSPPMYSRINYITMSGEPLLRPRNFDPGPPEIIPYR